MPEQAKAAVQCEVVTAHEDTAKQQTMCRPPKTTEMDADAAAEHWAKRALSIGLLRSIRASAADLGLFYAADLGLFYAAGLGLFYAADLDLLSRSQARLQTRA